MATHGPCETEGPGPLLPLLGPSGIKDITAGDQAPAAPPNQTARITPKPALRDRPGDNGRPRTGQDLHPSLHIV